MQTHQTKATTHASTQVDQTTKQQRDAEEEELLERSDELLDEIDDVLDDVAETELQRAGRMAREAMEDMIEEDLSDIFSRGFYFTGLCSCS
jgi:hypothetical protein